MAWRCAAECKETGHWLRLCLQSPHLHPQGLSIQHRAPALSDCKRGEDNPGDQQYQIRQRLGQIPRVQMLQWTFLNPAKLAWKSHYSQHCSYEFCRASCRAGNTTQPGSPGRLGVCSWTCKGEPKQMRLGWPTKQQPYPAPPCLTPVENLIPALLCIAPSSFQTSSDTADLPKSQGGGQRMFSNL